MPWLEYLKYQEFDRSGRKQHTCFPKLTFHMFRERKKHTSYLALRFFPFYFNPRFIIFVLIHFCLVSQHNLYPIMHQLSSHPSTSPIIIHHNIVLSHSSRAVSSNNMLIRYILSLPHDSILSTILFVVEN